MHAWCVSENGRSTRRDLHALVIIIVLFYVRPLYNYIAVDVPVYLSEKTAY